MLNGADVSEEHAIIDVTPDGKVILRNRSPVGTAVRGRPISICELQQGDEVKIGSAVRLLFGDVQDVAETRRADNPPGGAARRIKQLSPKQMALVIGLAVYLAGMVALVVMLERTPEAGTASAAAAAMQAAVEETREALLSARLATDGHAMLRMESVDTSVDPSGPYYALLAASVGDQPTAGLEGLVNDVLAPVIAHLRAAQILEQQGRLHDARRQYRAVLELLPDARLPAVQYATSRLAAIRKELPGDE